MKQLVPLLLLSLAFAGCTTSEPAVEQLHVRITDVGNTPYVLDVPLWLAPGGVAASAFVDHGEVVLGQITQVHVVETERGTALRLAGNGTAVVEFTDVRSSAGPMFSAGRMSLGVGGDGSSPLLHVLEGDVDVTWNYEGQSEHCYVPVNAVWNSEGTGWHLTHTFSRQSPAFDCQ